MAEATDLRSLLSAGEHAAFHGRPAAAITSLEQAVVLARQSDRPAEVAGAAWLLGVALAAAGRFGSAATVLRPLVDSADGQSAGPERRLFGSLAAASFASVQRQLGRHGDGRIADTQALALSSGSGEAGFDAQLGLAADAVGLNEPDEATDRLSRATELVEENGAAWWRQRVRLDWVRCEVALLTGRPADAVEHAQAAVVGAEENRAPRHVSKGLLFLGVSRLQAGAPEVAPALSRSAALAEGLGCLPLVWPARAMLGALIAETDPAESDRCLAAARAAVLTIAGDLPDTQRTGWLGRPDIAALLTS